MRPEDFPSTRYDFNSYITKHRLITYWYQFKEISALSPKNLLEVGVGTGLVTSYLQWCGVNVKTFDINESLSPDILGSILDAKSTVELSAYDVVLCARVLHHLPFDKFSDALFNLSEISKKHVVLTLPVEDASFYISMRYTSSKFFTRSISFPLFIKKILFLLKQGAKKEERQSSLWKINDSNERSMDVITTIINENFTIIDSYGIPEDKAHHVFVLEKNFTKT